MNEIILFSSTHQNKKLVKQMKDIGTAIAEYCAIVQVGEIQERFLHINIINLKTYPFTITELKKDRIWRDSYQYEDEIKNRIMIKKA